MKQQDILKFGVPTSILLGIYTIYQAAGDPIINGLAPIVEVLGQILHFFSQILVPFGEALADALLGPSIGILPSAGTGLLFYFAIFMGILILALYMNVAWRPRGYAKTKDKIEDDDEKGKEKPKDEIESKALDASEPKPEPEIKELDKGDEGGSPDVVTDDDQEEND
ncbi:MAG: hypothetical protein ACFFCS_12270 [Candidatus Hodarchaeota archaeon]